MSIRDLFAVSVCLCLLTTCSGKTENARQDSAKTADSIRSAQAEAKVKVKAETARLDSIRLDSIMQLQINEEFKNPLTVIAGKESVYNIPEGTQCVMTLPMTVTNNTSVPWEPRDYRISYSYLTEYWDKDFQEEDRWFPKTVKGQAIAPMANIKLSDQNNGWEYRSLKIKPQITKEQFAQKFKEQTVFDKTQNRFVPKK